MQFNSNDIRQENILTFQYTFNNMQRYTVYFYLETGLHVLGGTTTHNQ